MMRHCCASVVVRPFCSTSVVCVVCHMKYLAQEFLRFMLDALHEDTNTARKPVPYEEIKESESDPDDVVSERWWKNYCVRNRSFVKELFCGQLRSAVTCSKCGHVSRCFDPFWDLSVSSSYSLRCGLCVNVCVCPDMCFGR